jgi:hypothetical protein
MPSLNDLLEDRAQYPDTQEITLAGVTTTLGDLREQGYFRKADYTKKTTELARHREAFAREKAEFEQARAGAEAELAKMVEQAVGRRETVAAANPTATADDVERYLASDPVSQRILARVADATKALDEMRAQQTQLAEGMKRQQEAMLVDFHNRALATLDPRMKEYEVSRDDLVKYAQQNSIPRLDLAFDLMTRDKQLEAREKAAAEKAHAAAYEKAKLELNSPTLPRRRVAAAPAVDAPKTFDEAADAAARDPEILATLEGSA